MNILIQTDTWTYGLRLGGAVVSNTFASRCYGLGLILTVGYMWDVFHPSQPMPGGFPLGVFFHPQKGSNLFHLELSHKANWPGQNLFWVT